MGTDQAGFVARVRGALGRTSEAAPRQATEVTGDDWVARADRIRAEALRRWDELVPRFTAELEAVAGVVHRAAVSSVPALISRIATERNLARVVTWSESALGLPGLLKHLRAEGLEVDDGSPQIERPASPETMEGVRRVLDRGDIGVTGVDYAVAESGSLVLISGAGKGRLVSCLPRLHVAILRPGQLVETLEEVGVLFEALHCQGPPEDPPSNIAFITGPSRTADIELSLTRGVHGPAEVHIIAVEA